MSIETEDLARTALVRLMPRGRYRLAAPTDARFATFVPQTVRLAYRQQGAQPSFVLFCGPGQDVLAAALAAAEYAAANWRPNAVQRRVRPGVVAVQVAPATELQPAGPIAGAAVPTTLWTVDSESGRCSTPASPPGAPSGGEVRRAAAALLSGVPPPAIGELDYAERALMHPRSMAMPGALSGGLGLILALFALRFGLAPLAGVFGYGSLFGTGHPGLALAGVAVDGLLVIGIALGAAILLNFQNLALRVPGFASTVPRTRTATWIGYAVVMALLAAGANFVLPSALRSAQGGGGGGQLAHVVATTSDDGSQTAVLAGGDLRVDLSAWPRSEWAGVRFTTSNPSVLTLVSQPISGGAPIVFFQALGTGAARVDASSADGRYTFELRVTVVTD